MSEFKFTRQNIEYIHNENLTNFGGGDGVRDDALLTSVLASPYQECFGKSLYPDIIAKAVKYLFDFTNYQVFIDGNKRMGLSTSTVFLAMNGLKMDLSEDNQYELVMKIANGGYKHPYEVIAILRNHIVRTGRGILPETEFEAVTNDTMNNLQEALKKLAAGPEEDNEVFHELSL